MIAYDYNCNAILAYPLNQKNEDARLEAIKHLHAHLNSKSTHPKLHVLDNECSELVNDYIKNTLNIALLLVPPYLHLTNAAEKPLMHSKTIPLLVSPRLTLPFPFICGAGYFL